MMSTLKVACGATVLALVLAGCASTGEREFGSSVRHMVEGQTYDPAAPRPGVAGVDGHKAAQAVEAYRAGKKPAAKQSAIPSVLVPTSQ